jgi:cytochrome c oxidase cbb3-type subunit 4
MYKNVLQSIENIQVWPVISFIIFFIFFLCLLWWVYTADHNYIETMKSLPVDNDKLANSPSNNAKLQQP